jgi:hypothetical protein
MHSVTRTHSLKFQTNSPRPGSDRAHINSRHGGGNVVLSFSQVTFRTGLLMSLSGTRIHYRKPCTARLPCVSTPVR